MPENGLENIWSLLKRSIKGISVSAEPFHLFRYLDEQTFRFNSRKLSDGLRFLSAAVGIIDKRERAYREERGGPDRRRPA